jgi:hypothetical protein
MGLTPYNFSDLESREHLTLPTATSGCSSATVARRRVPDRRHQDADAHHPDDQARDR